MQSEHLGHHTGEEIVNYIMHVHNILLNDLLTITILRYFQLHHAGP